LEYTVFSEKIIAKKEYEKKLSGYLSHRYGLKPDEYQIKRKEYGVIPMEDRPALPWYKPRIMNIGTRGGVTKPSTGYTFMRIQNQVENIVEGLIEDNKPRFHPSSESRFKAYDLWLLHIIYNSPDKAIKILEFLFQNNSMDEVFCFLNEDSTLGEDLQIMSSVPYWPFLKAIWKSKNRFKEMTSK
jgi:lycopene beta-cyclase